MSKKDEATVDEKSRFEQNVNKWSRKRRLEFIDFRLSIDGRINRSDLVEFFGISVPQASLDLSVYKELSAQQKRKNFVYDVRQKVYVRTDDFEALFPEQCNTESFFTDLKLIADNSLSRSRNFFGFTPNVSVSSLNIPERQVIKQKVLTHILEAMRAHLALHIVYKSLSNSKPEDYLVAPHSFAFDGYRWHIRAYCYDNHAFKDYVLSRVQKTETPRIKAPTDRFPDPISNGFREVGTSAEDDADWNEIVTLVLQPNPDLDENARRAVELDYGLEPNQTFKYEVKKALLLYALHSLQLAKDYESLPAKCRQVTLVNKDEVFAVLDEILK